MLLGMRLLALVVGLTALFVALLTWARREVVNTTLLGVIVATALITYTGLPSNQRTVVAATHLAFIFLVYAGSLLTTGVALGFFAMLSTLALATRLYYDQCLFSTSYNDLYVEPDVAEPDVVQPVEGKSARDRRIDIVYIVPLLVIAIRCVADLHRAPAEGAIVAVA